MSIKYDTNIIMLNQHAKYIGQRSRSSKSKIIVQADISQCTMSLTYSTTTMVLFSITNGFKQLRNKSKTTIYVTQGIKVKHEKCTV